MSRIGDIDPVPSSGHNALMDILDMLKNRFTSIDRSLWEPVALAAGVGRHMPRKMVYGDRASPRIDTCQKLINYFEAVDRGEKTLPIPLVKPAQPAKLQAAQEA